MSLKEVASELHVSLRSVERWRELISREISRKQAPLWKGEIAEQGSKMITTIITESPGKRGTSTREIVSKLTDKAHCISNTAVYRCLRSDSSYTWRNRQIVSSRSRDVLWGVMNWNQSAVPDRAWADGEHYWINNTVLIHDFLVQDSEKTFPYFQITAN